MTEIRLENEAATIAYAHKLAAEIKPGQVVALSGELGAGKSVFARSLMRSLDVKDEALPSPTFAIIQEYDGKGCKVAHMDWYRLEDAGEIEMLGVRDYFEPHGSPSLSGLSVHQTCYHRMLFASKSKPTLRTSNFVICLEAERPLSAKSGHSDFQYADKKGDTSQSWRVMSQSISKEAIRELAGKHGFELCSFTRPEIKPEHQDAYKAWVEAGMHGDMGYMAEETRLERRKSPASMLEGIKSVISVGMKHAPPAYSLEKIGSERDRGVIAAYAYGDDYHEVMKKRLKAFARELDELLGQHDQRVYVDTAPVLEHALAAEGGLGWQGKHTLTINREHGSYLILGEIFTTAEIEPDAPAEFHCGTCTACIDVCPTKAIVAPFIVDARLCISYLTIEYRGFIPHQLRPLMGNRIFGCDDCQVVCPWNRKADVIELDHLKPRDENLLPELTDFFGLDDEGFRERFRKSPVKRAGRAGLLRNVAIAMGNSGNTEYIPLLMNALDDQEALVRGHSAWAAGQIIQQNPQSSDGEIAAQLEYHAQNESDEDVLNELHQSLKDIGETS